jgi:hypothetical protein
LKDAYPRDITVFLIEGERFDHGAPLSPAVQTQMEALAQWLVTTLNSTDAVR